MLPDTDSQSEIGVSAITSPEITRVVPVLSLPPLVVSPVSSNMARL